MAAVAEQVRVAAPWSETACEPRREAKSTHAPALKASAHRPLALSVVVPTLNERDNVFRLFAKLDVALAALSWEAIFVDDGSSDGTSDMLTELAQGDPRARLIRRFGRRGLSSAVIEGMLSSTAPVVAVMDADLQHDEAVLPRLIDAVSSGSCDLAVGSRYAVGGSIGDWSKARATASRIATRLAELATQASLADPMSGFFAVRRDRLVAAAPYLTGTGYKLLLDLVASSPTPLQIKEVSYRFRSREAGESKLDAMVALEYLQLLLEKTIGRFVPVRFLMFSIVGTLGIGVHLAVLAAVLRAGLPFAPAATMATVTAMTCNFALNNLFTYRDRRLRRWRAVAGLVKFYAACALGAAANVAVGSVLSGSCAWWLAGIAGAAIGVLWNYAASTSSAWCKAG